jgi:hypothetical protein
MRVPFVILFVTALFPAILPAQDVLPSPITVLQQWQQSQQSATDGIVGLRVRERILRVSNGPLGNHRLETVAELMSPLNRLLWRRTLQEARLNGRSLNRRQLNRIEQNNLNQLGTRFTALYNILPPATRLLTRMRSFGSTIMEQVGNQQAYRIEAEPQQDFSSDRPGLPTIERVTYWITPQTGQLVQTRIEFALQGDLKPTVVTTTYHRIKGLDLPERMHLESMVQQRRRLRTFTVLVTIDASYDNYQAISQLD